MMIPPVCIFVHVEYCQLDVGYEQPLLGALLLDVLHEGVPLQRARRQPGVRLLQVGQPDVVVEGYDRGDADAFDVDEVCQPDVVVIGHDYDVDLDGHLTL